MACRVTIWHGDTHALPSISLRCCSVKRFLRYKNFVTGKHKAVWEWKEICWEKISGRHQENLQNYCKESEPPVCRVSCWSCFYLISTKHILWCVYDQAIKKMLQQQTQDIFWNNLPVLGLWNSCICNCVCFCVIYYASSVMICNGFALVTNDWLRFLSRTGGKNFNFFQVCTLCSSKDYGRQGF